MPILVAFVKTVLNMGTGFLVVIVVLAGLVVLARVMRLEDAFIYFPDHETYTTPEAYGLAYEEVRFGEEGRLHGWFIPGRTDVTHPLVPWQREQPIASRAGGVHQAHG